MNTYKGSCHCGKVKFEVDTMIDKVIHCNCSICTKKGALHHRVLPHQFRLLKGSDFLSLYKFNTKIASHFSCKKCGMQPFTNPRTAPDMYSINVRCLDNFDLDRADFQLIEFDGKNFETSINSLNKMHS